MTDIQKEIQDMIDDVAPAAVVEEKEAFGEVAPEPLNEEVKEPEVIEPEPEVKEPVVESPAEPVVEEAPALEAPAGEVVEDPRIVAMQNTLNEMAARLLETKPVVAQPVAAAPVAEQPVEIDLTKFPIIPEGVDFEDIVNSKDSFIGFMRDLLGRYEVTRVRRDALATPTLVSRQVQYTLGLHEAVRSFYESNKDLVKVKPLVGAFSNKFVAEHPDWSLAQVMEESAKATRAAIGAGGAPVKAAPVPVVKATVKPSFVTTNASRNAPGGVKKTKLQSEIEDLLTDI